MTRSLVVFARCASALALLAGCAGWMDRVRDVADRAAAAIDGTTYAVLADYCRHTARARGYRGVLEDDLSRPSGVRCRNDGVLPDDPPGVAEKAELAALRRRWAPVLDAADEVARLQAGLARALRSDDASQALVALGSLAAAYQRLQKAQRTAGLPVSRPLALEAP